MVVVEGAQADEAAPPPGQGDEALHDLDDVRALADVVDDLPGDLHRCPRR